MRKTNASMIFGHMSRADLPICDCHWPLAMIAPYISTMLDTSLRIQTTIPGRGDDGPALFRRALGHL
jgi:hypothetical protein